MRSSNIQTQLLSEVRTPQKALNYAVNRERGQANQQEILKTNTSWNTVSYVRQNKPRKPTSNTQQTSMACSKGRSPFSIAHPNISKGWALHITVYTKIDREATSTWKPD